MVTDEGLDLDAAFEEIARLPHPPTKERREEKEEVPEFVLVIDPERKP